MSERGTGARRRAVAARGRSEVLAPPKPAQVALSALTSVVIFFGASLDGLRSDSFVGYLRALPVSIVVTVGMYLIGSSRVVSRGATLEVVNVVTLWRIGRGSVERVDVENGVFIVADGRQVDCFAWGPSLFQAFVTSQRMRRLQGALRAWAGLRDDADPTGVSRHARPDIPIAIAVVLLTTCAVAFGLWSVRDAVLPIIGE